jgi:predicted DNA-binding transcriptional regulator AlpA
MVPHREPVERLLLSINDVEHMTALTRSRIYELMGEGLFPRPVVIPKNTKRWKYLDVVHFVDNLPREQPPGPSNPGQ